jgi:hypothetical protein
MKPSFLPSHFAPVREQSVGAGEVDLSQRTWGKGPVDQTLVDQESHTPKDVRMLFATDARSHSDSILIAPSKESASEAKLGEETSQAEYRDYCMYQRIMSAKQRQQQRHLPPPAGAIRIPALYADSLQNLLLENFRHHFAHQTETSKQDDNDFEEIFELEL